MSDCDPIHRPGQGCWSRIRFRRRGDLRPCPPARRGLSDTRPPSRGAAVGEVVTWNGWPPQTHGSSIWRVRPSRCTSPGLRAPRSVHGAGRVLVRRARGPTSRRRLDRIPVLRRRLVEVPLAIDHPCWIDDPGFDLEHHLHHVDPARAEDQPTSSPTSSAGSPSRGSIAADPCGRCCWWTASTTGGGAGDEDAPLHRRRHLRHGSHGAPARPDRRRRATVEHGSRWRPERVPSTVETVASATWNRMVTPFRPVRAAVGVGSALVHAADTSVRRRIGGAESGAHPFNAPRTAFNSTVTARRAVAFGRGAARRPEDRRPLVRRDDQRRRARRLHAGASGTYLERRDELPDRSLIVFGPRRRPEPARRARARPTRCRTSSCSCRSTSPTPSSSSG